MNTTRTFAILIALAAIGACVAGMFLQAFTRFDVGDRMAYYCVGDGPIAKVVGDEKGRALQPIIVELADFNTGPVNTTLTVLAALAVCACILAWNAAANKPAATPT